nr:MAG: hypothetical protein [Molluscum contagiosum virus]
MRASWNCAFKSLRSFPSTVLSRAHAGLCGLQDRVRQQCCSRAGSCRGGYSSTAATARSASSTPVSMFGL